MTNTALSNRSACWFLPYRASSDPQFETYSDTDASGGYRLIEFRMYENAETDIYFIYLEAWAFVYNPVIQGEIDLTNYNFSVRVREDTAVPEIESTIGGSCTYSLGIRQDDTLYVCQEPMRSALFGSSQNGDEYQLIEQSGQTADYSVTNFNSYFINTSDAYLYVGDPEFDPIYHPDLEEGSTIRLGIVIKLEHNEINGPLDHRDYYLSMDDFTCRTLESDPDKEFKKLGVLRLSTTTTTI